MSLTINLSNLVDEIAVANELTATQETHFRSLADAWETSLATSAAIEPDDDYRENDEQLLKVLNKQEDEYATLLVQADAEVKEAFDAYLAYRLNKLN